LNIERIIGYCSNETHIKHKGKEINEESFEYKGCWNCIYFERVSNFPYYDVEEISELLCVSKNTIRRTINKGKLEGRLFRRQEHKFKYGGMGEIFY